MKASVLFGAVAIILLVTAPAAADEFVIDIRGVTGTPYAGSCTLLIGRGRNQTVSFAGLIPKGHMYNAPAINCTVKRTGGSGDIEVRLWRDKDVVAKAESPSWVKIWSTGKGGQSGSWKRR